MSVERRVSKLEEKIDVSVWDQKADEELTAWLKANPGCFSQQDIGEEIVWPEHISKAWRARLDRAFKKRGLAGNLSDLRYIVNEIYP